MESELIVQSVPQGADEGSTTQHRVARNAGIYLILQIVSWAVTLVGISIVPRFLGAQVLGEIVLAATTVNMVFVVGMFSIDAFLIREVGRDAVQTERLVRATLGLRLVVLLPLALTTFIVLKCLHATPVIYLYSEVSTVGMAFYVFSEPLRSTLAGQERAFQVSISDLIISSSVLLAIPFLRYGGIVLPLTSLIGILVASCLRYSWVRAGIRLRPTFDVNLWKILIKGGMPFGLNVYLSGFNSYITLLILHRFLNEAAIGQYSQASRLRGY